MDNNTKKMNNSSKQINNISKVVNGTNNNTSKNQNFVTGSPNTSLNQMNQSNSNKSSFNSPNTSGQNNRKNNNSPTNNSRNRKNNNSPKYNNNTPANNSKGNNNRSSNNSKSNNNRSQANNTKSNNNTSKVNNSTLNNSKSNNAGKSNNVSNGNNSNNHKIDELLEELEKNNNTSNNNRNSNNKSNNKSNNNSNNKSNNNAKNNVNETANAAVNAANNAAQSSIVWTILKIILIGVVFIIVINVIKYFYTTYENYKANTPWLLDGNKNAKHALVISQNPDNKNTPKINRSDGRSGIELTYSLWMLIDDFNYKQTEWKHVFHKGNESAYPTIAPGVWIHPNKNMLRVYMNTMKKIHEYVDIDDIPLRKWIHLAIVVRNQTLEIYINGYLKTKQKLSSIPRQNNEDLWINLNGGFEGFVSRMRYFSYAVTPTELSDIIKSGPADSACIDTAEIPPYLDDNWWF